MVKREYLDEDDNSCKQKKTKNDEYAIGK